MVIKRAKDENSTRYELTISPRYDFRPGYPRTQGETLELLLTGYAREIQK